MDASCQRLSCSMKRRQIVFVGKGQVEIIENDLAPLGENQVLVRTEVSLMSTGTENICFNRLFSPGSHFDKWVQYPHAPGYSTVGIIEALGSNVQTAKVGDRVGHRRGHASHHVLDEDGIYPVPDGVPADIAAWFALAHITHNGARCIRYQIGDKVAIVGAGPIGQMSLRWAVASGIDQAIVIDSQESRLQLARKGGSTYTVAAPIADARKLIEAKLGGAPDIVVDATGHPQVFEAVLSIVKNQGKVLLIGDTGTPAEQRLTPDVVTRALTIQGAHDTTVFHDIDRQGVAQLFFHLVSSGRFPMEGMNTHYFAPEEAKQAYGVANESRDQTMGILFQW